MKKQTAVEWLLNEIADNHKTPRQWQEIAEQAKAMEKEQIKNAIICNQNGLLRRKTVLEAEQYYNETYGTK
jgi:hypothetical protein